MVSAASKIPAAGTSASNRSLSQRWRIARTIRAKARASTAAGDGRRDQCPHEPERDFAPSVGVTAARVPVRYVGVWRLRGNRSEEKRDEHAVCGHGAQCDASRQR